mmetsp:Transcript_12646/g.18972  ORF Transcript_12646/g.18972 Transcript_12646/m.18972 type:complete len:271 (-) Transcript_12646:415-1227(-)
MMVVFLDSVLSLAIRMQTVGIIFLALHHLLISLVFLVFAFLLTRILPCFESPSSNLYILRILLDFFVGLLLLRLYRVVMLHIVLYCICDYMFRYVFYIDWLLIFSSVRLNVLTNWLYLLVFSQILFLLLLPLCCILSVLLMFVLIFFSLPSLFLFLLLLLLFLFLCLFHLKSPLLHHRLSLTSLQNCHLLFFLSFLFLFFSFFLFFLLFYSFLFYHMVSLLYSYLLYILFLLYYLLYMVFLLYYLLYMVFLVLVFALLLFVLVGCYFVVL